MARKIVGLIGNGQGPVVHVEGDLRASIEGLKQGGVVIAFVDGHEPNVFESNGVFPLPHGRRLFFAAEHASRELVCNVLMEV